MWTQIGRRVLVDENYYDNATDWQTCTRYGRTPRSSMLLLCAPRPRCALPEAYLGYREHCAYSYQRYGKYGYSSNHTYGYGYGNKRKQDEHNDK